MLFNNLEYSVNGELRVVGTIRSISLSSDIFGMGNFP